MAEDLEAELEEARRNVIRGAGRISSFWGLSKSMGEIFGLLYLNPTALSLDEVAQALGLSKGAVSTHIRSLERLGMVHKIWNVGDRRDYYEAETDFWRIAKGIFREREKKEFNEALNSIRESLKIINLADPMNQDETANFYRQRLQEMQKFFRTLDKLVDAVQALTELRLGALAALGHQSED